jgi:hypothetical protein
MRKALKNDVTIVRPVSMPAQRSEGEGMSRVVGQIEAAFEGQVRFAGIAKPSPCRSEQSVEFLLIAGFRFQLACSD